MLGSENRLRERLYNRLSHHPCYKESTGVILHDVLMQSKPLEKTLKTKTKPLKALILPSENNFCQGELLVKKK